MKNKKFKTILAVVGIIILLSVIALAVILKITKSQREEAKVKKLAGLFYEYYYEVNTDPKDKDKIKVFLSNYASSGLKVKLKDIETYIDTHKAQNYNILKDCDTNKTVTTIYPEAPYGKKDFRIEVKMKCKK